MRTFCALQVGRRAHRLLGVEAARAAVHPAQRHQPGRAGADLVQQLLADRAVDDLAHVRLVAEDEGHVEHVHVRHHRADHAQRNARDLDRAELHLLDHFLLAAEHAAREHLQLDAALRARFELLAHVLHRDDGRVAGRVGVGSLEREGLRLGAEGEGGRQGGECVSQFHVFLFLGCGCMRAVFRACRRARPGRVRRDAARTRRRPAAGRRDRGPQAGST